MTTLTSAVHFFQALDRSLLSLGYTAEIASVNSSGDGVRFAVEVIGSIDADDDVYATADLTIKSSDIPNKAWVYDVSVDYYPYTKDDLVRDINAAIPGKIGDKLVRPLDVARVLASQFNALGLDPAATIEQVV